MIAPLDIGLRHLAPLHIPRVELHLCRAQLEGYLGRLGLTEGFLVIFDRRRAAEEVPWDERPRWENEVLAGGKRVKVLRL